MRSFWREFTIEQGCIFVIILLFIGIIAYSAVTGRRQPLPAGAYDPRIYPEQHR